ncbi:hypothetical protein CUU64_19765 [Bacillus sp. V5-8f]|nr:hypothetical protein CUU64_19765 [Bacillus sp. V5-8f]
MKGRTFLEKLAKVLLVLCGVFMLVGLIYLFFQ